MARIYICSYVALTGLALRGGGCFRRGKPLRYAMSPRWGLHGGNVCFRRVHSTLIYIAPLGLGGKWYINAHIFSLCLVSIVLGSNIIRVPQFLILFGCKYGSSSFYIFLKSHQPPHPAKQNSLSNSWIYILLFLMLHIK